MRLSSDIRQDLFDYFDNEHGIMLLDSDFNEIENIIEPMAMSCKPHIIGRLKNRLALQTRLVRIVNNVTTGREAKRIRKKRGLTQIEVSKKMKITQAYLAQLETGKTNWTKKLLNRFNGAVR